MILDSVQIYDSSVRKPDSSMICNLYRMIRRGVNASYKVIGSEPSEDSGSEFYCENLVELS